MPSDTPFSLAGKNILVTGGTRGIGRAISLRFARAGASVLAGFVRGIDTAGSLEEEAARESLDIQCLQADLSRASGPEKIEEALADRGWELSALVHCAATGVHKKVQEYTARDMKWVFSLNIEGYITLVSRLVDHLVDGSSIVAISSKGGTRAVPSYGLVGASKGALEAYSRQMAAELAEQGIRVNLVTPGAVRTDAWDAFPESEARLEAAAARTPIGRLVTPDEVACAAQFLCSDAASGITGETLVVDGGVGILD